LEGGESREVRWDIHQASERIRQVFPPYSVTAKIKGLMIREKYNEHAPHFVIDDRRKPFFNLPIRRDAMPR
jgi:hypothetical protein